MDIPYCQFWIYSRGGGGTLIVKKSVETFGKVMGGWLPSARGHGLTDVAFYISGGLTLIFAECSYVI
jgi:hypothetical protein